MIPEGKTLEDIKAREKIIRDFYREWKTRNPSQQRMKKGTETMPFVLAPECVREIYALRV